MRITRALASVVVNMSVLRVAYATFSTISLNNDTSAAIYVPRALNRF